jgi:hypothetical protein
MDATGVELRAFAVAFSQWPADEVWGHASDGQREVLIHGRTVDGVMVFGEPILLDPSAEAVTS